MRENLIVFYQLLLEINPYTFFLIEGYNMCTVKCIKAPNLNSTILKIRMHCVTTTKIKIQNISGTS